MRMAVDQAREQGVAREADDLGVCDGGLRCDDVCDPAVLDDDRAIGMQFAGDNVEDELRPDDDARRGHRARLPTC
jgi:hypothetical protein